MIKIAIVVLVVLGALWLANKVRGRSV